MAARTEEIDYIRVIDMVGTVCGGPCKKYRYNQKRQLVGILQYRI